MVAAGKTPRKLRVGSWAVRLAAFCATLILAGALLHRLFGLETLVMLNLFLLAFIGASVAILMAAYALFRIWQRGYRGTGSALAAIAISGAILMWPVSLLPTVWALPEINDVTTDTVNPPELREAAELRPKGANAPTYTPAFAAKQKSAYPDLRTMRVDRNVSETMTLVTQALKRLRMTIVMEVPPDAQNSVGYIEAVDRTVVFGFTDDVAIRIAATGSSSLVDVRSASRFGRHDLGRNATRVRDILSALVERIQATVPKTDGDKR